MIYPPIDKLIEKVNCKYALVVLVAKRAQFISEKKADLLIANDETALTHAAKEVFDGSVVAHFEE